MAQQQGCHRGDLLISIPLTPFSRGHIRASGLSIASWLSLPANSGPASDDALFGTRARDPRSRRPGPHGGFLLPDMIASVRND